jgi:hypothetical protein
MKAIVAVVLLTAAAFGVTAWLVHGDRALSVLTPSPGRVVQTFVGALAAHRSGPAEAQLAEPVREPALIQRLDRELRERHGDYRFAGAESTGDGERAEVRAELRTRRDGIIQRRFRLERDPRTRLWRVVDVEQPG